MIDGLTGLWNRACFEQRLAAELSLSRRAGHPLACAMMDLDHFKQLNDRHGHPFGDEVLRGVAQVLLDAARAEDVVCRYGGEEFVILVPNADADRAFAMGQRVCDAVARRLFISRRTPVEVTCSIGVADNLENRGARMVELADKALYLAKQRGRNRAVGVRDPEINAAA